VVERQKVEVAERQKAEVAEAEITGKATLYQLGHFINYI